MRFATLASTLLGAMPMAIGSPRLRRMRLRSSRAHGPRSPLGGRGSRAKASSIEYTSSSAT